MSDTERNGSHRTRQVAELIRQVIALAFAEGEVRDPRVGLVTVSGVEVSGDLSVATIRVVPHGDDAAARELAMNGIQSAAGFLRTKVAQALTTRVTPELRFVYDHGLEHARRIDQLLADVHDEENPS